MYAHINKYSRFGNLLMLFATRISNLAAFMWSPRFTCIWNMEHRTKNNIHANDIICYIHLNKNIAMEHHQILYHFRWYPDTVVTKLCITKSCIYQWNRVVL